MWKEFGRSERLKLVKRICRVGIINETTRMPQVKCYEVFRLQVKYLRRKRHTNLIEASLFVMTSQTSRLKETVEMFVLKLNYHSHKLINGKINDLRKITKNSFGL